MLDGTDYVRGRFGSTLQPRRCRGSGKELELRPQAFHALEALIHNRGRYVGYAQMINQAWDGNLISKHTVAVTIGEVKKILGEFGHWISYRPKLGYRLEVPHSDDLVKQGWHFWSRRTREGFEKALDCFQQAAIENSSDYRAFEGISLCYLLLGHLWNARAARDVQRVPAGAQARRGTVRPYSGAPPPIARMACTFSSTNSKRPRRNCCKPSGKARNRRKSTSG